MKTLKLIVASGLVMFGLVLCGHAAVNANNDSPANGGFGPFELGSVDISSGTNPQPKSRRMAMDDLGNAKVIGGFKEVVKSTGSGLAGLFVAGTSSQTFAVRSSSWVGVTGCRGLMDNCNVIRIADLNDPVYVDKIQVGVAAGAGATGGLTGAGSGRTTIRMWDSRGATNYALVPEIFNMSVTSGTTHQVDYWCTSGTVLMVDSPAEVKVFFGKQDR